MLNMNSKKANYLIAIVVLMIYTLIGYLFDIDVLKIFVFRTNEYNISIFGVVLWIFTAIFLKFICNYLAKR